MTARTAGSFAALLIMMMSSSTPTTTLAASTPKPDRKVVIRNESGRRIEVSWVHPNTKARSLMSEPDVLTGAEFNLNSFVSHEFEMKELPAKRTGQCLTPGDCRVTFWAVNENDMQVITINEEFEIEHDDHTTKARKAAGEALADCKAKGQDLVKEGKALDDVLKDVATCMRSHVTDKLSDAADEITFSAETRKTMAEDYEIYTCADFELESSQSVENTTWYDKKARTRRDVKVLLSRPEAKIHLVENFIMDDECDAMEAAAAPKLERAVVANGSGGHEVSENRQAMQAGIAVAWDKEGSGDPIARISRRVYDYADHVLSLDIDEHGQEDLMSIQYFGKGEDSEEQADQYKPHCDGDCTGDKHKFGTRVATMVMYCTVPTKGGATNFRNSGLHVQPQKGNAVFFAYVNPKTMTMDKGLTEHSGCPVVEGEKKIVTQWIRYGVTEEVPWTSYNSLGLRKDAFKAQGGYE